MGNSISLLILSLAGISQSMIITYQTNIKMCDAFKDAVSVVQPFFTKVFTNITF